MTSPALFGSYGYAALAAALAGLLFTIVHPVFHGLGGTLGTTAFVAVTLVVHPTTGSFQSGPLPRLPVLMGMVVFAGLGALSTFAVHTRAPPLRFGVRPRGCRGRFLLPMCFDADGGLFATAVYSTSFAGMTDPRRIPNEW